MHTGCENQPTSDVEVSTSTPQLDDIYVVLSSWDTSGSSVSLRVLVKPLVILLWIGGLVYFAGILIVAWHIPQPRLPSYIVSAAKPGTP